MCRDRIRLSTYIVTQYTVCFVYFLLRKAANAHLFVSFLFCSRDKRPRRSYHVYSQLVSNKIVHYPHRNSFRKNLVWCFKILMNQRIVLTERNLVLIFTDSKLYSSQLFDISSLLLIDLSKWLCVGKYRLHVSVNVFII